jgi:hypothetical protein
MRPLTTSRRVGGYVLGAMVTLLVAARPAGAQDRSRATLETGRIKDNALWTGLRLGVFLPSGGLYADGNLVTIPFRDVASAGPVVEVDVGARFVRHFIGYAFVEQAFLGRGGSAAWTLPHGGQSNASTQALGIGLRWDSHPEGVGFAADVAVGYRWFTARWADATKVSMHGLGDIRLGVGVSWRVASRLAIAPMITLSSGRFTERTLDGQTLGDTASSYAAAELSLSGHMDF